MLIYFQLAISIASIVTFIYSLIATYHYLPNNTLNHFSIDMMNRLTEDLQTTGSFRKFLYWFFPLMVIYTTSMIAGVFLLLIAIVGVVFRKRYDLKVDHLRFD